MVRFAPESLSEKTYMEPSAQEGPLIITFFVKRVKGILGEIKVSFFILFLSRAAICLTNMVERTEK